jgi:adenylate cyclase
MRLLFDGHVLDTERRELHRGCDAVAVEPQVLDLLIYLVENRDRVVSRDDLLASIWDGRIVSDATLTSRIYAARKAIGDSGRDQKLIRTVARKGHRFVGDIESEAGVVQPAIHAAPSPSDRIRRETGPALPLPDRPSIAVLPFTNMSGDAEDEYFSDGITEDIITALSRLRWFFVISRNSSFVYKGKSVHIRQVGEELGVGYVIEGSVRRAGDRLRITVQLNDVTTGSHIWAERYDRALADVFAVQDEITQTIVGVINPSLLQAEIERTKRKRPESLDAYGCVLQAYPHIWAFDPTSNTTALAYLNRAIGIEPDYPLALALAAWCKAREVIYNWTSELDAAKLEGLRLAKLAGDLSSDDPMVLTALCAAHSVVGDLDIASVLIEKAVTLDPSSAMAWNRSGWVNAYLDRPEIAIEHFQRALRLSPFDPTNFNCFFGIRNAHFAAGRYEESLAWCKRGMAERPDLVWPLRSMAAALAHLGRVSEARDAVLQLRNVYPDITIAKIMAITPHRGDYLERYAEGLRRAGLPE